MRFVLPFTNTTLHSPTEKDTMAVQAQQHPDEMAVIPRQTKKRAELGACFWGTQTFDGCTLGGIAVKLPLFQEVTQIR